MKQLHIDHLFNFKNKKRCTSIQHKTTAYLAKSNHIFALVLSILYPRIKKETQGTSYTSFEYEKKYQRFMHCQD